MDYMTSLGNDQQFQNLKSSKDRIEFILKHIRPLNEFREEMFRIGDKFFLTAQKSADKSKSLLDEGLEFYGDGNYRSAISLFIRAILLAPYPLEEHISDNCLSIAFAYKAFSEFELKDYKNSLLSACNSLDFLETNEMLLLRIQCLRILKRFSEALQILDQMIEKSENTEPNGEVMELDNLNSIKQYIIQQMAKSDNPSDLLPESVSKTSDLKVSSEEMKDSTINVWVHPSCQLNCTEEKGRHFKVDNFIPKGTVLLVERPASVVIHKEKTKNYCLNCWKPIGRQIWPCIGCNEVVFCNKECFLEGFDNFHQYECGILSVFFRFGNNFPHLFRYISRVGVRKAFECENENKNFDFKSYIECHKKDRGKPSSNQNTEKNSFYEREYKGFHSMSNHFSKVDKYSHIFLIFRSIEMAVLFEYTKQLDFDVEKDFQLFVELVNICLIGCNRLHINVFGMYDTPPQKQKQLIGGCHCTVASLFNHSCEPNLFWGFNDQKIYFKAIKDINEGEELTITYGPTYQFWDFIKRQKKLKFGYYFDCNCKACLRDCQTVLCIKCEQCLGAVVHRVCFPPHIKRDYCCLHCGHKYRPKDLKKSILEIEDSFNTFTQMMIHLDNNYNIELSLNMAEKSLNSLLRLAYSKCQPLRDSIRQMVRVYALHGLFDKAVQYVQHFDIDYYMDLDKDSLNGDILDDLLLLTNCYFMYLNENEVNDTNHWNMCFQLYSKLIEVLKRAKKSSKKIKTDDKESVNSQTIRSVIEDKKEELNQLIESYQSLVNQF